VTTFLDMLRAAQFDPEKQSLEKATTIVAESIRPNELAKLQEDKHSEAWRVMSLSNAPLSKRVEGFQTALELHDKALAALVETHSSAARVLVLLRKSL
jgi:hypothetical protein